MIGDVDKNLLSGLIDMVITRKNMSDRVKQVFVKNIGLFRERFNV
jgi:acetyl-CoA carboxylase beta subunit